MLKTENLTKTFGNIKALDSVSLSFEKEKIVCLLGENGAGKTTLLRAMAGIFSPDSGKTTLDDEPVFDNPKAKEKISLYAYSENILPNFTVKQVLDFYEGLYKNFDRKKFDSFNKIFEINTAKKISSFSMGNRARIFLMLSLAVNPDYALFDEPLNGLDISSKKEFFEMLTAEAEKFGTGIIVSSHNIKDLEPLCDEIVIINKGKLILKDETDRLKNTYSKYQVVFEDETNVDFSSIPSLLEYKKEGRVYFMYFDEENLTVPKNYKTIMFEKIEMSLEEIFLLMGR